LIGAADLVLAGLVLVGAVCAALGWAGFMGVAGWVFAGLGSLEALGLRALPSVLGLRSVIVSPGLVPGCQPESLEQSNVRLAALGSV
jgi:hypothetical protein